MTPQNNRFAFLLMVVSMTVLSIGDAVVRLLGEMMPVGQLIALRGVVLIAVLAIAVRARGIALDPRKITNRWSMIRGLAETVSTYSFFISLQFIPIAVATTVVFIYPVMLTLASIPILGERVGFFRMGAVILGFVGVVIVAAPTNGEFETAMIYPLMAAAAVVARDLCTRKINAEIDPGTVILTTAIVTTLAGFASLPLGWIPLQPMAYPWVPLQPLAYPLLVVAALLIATSFVTYVMAVREGEMSIIAPAQYIVILWATIWGALIWNEIPGISAAGGGLLIIFAGLIILWRERVGHIKRKPSVLPLE